MMDKIKLLKVIYGDNLSEGKMIQCLPNVDKVLSELTEREQIVLNERFSGKTLREVGKMILNLRKSEQGISGARVRQIEAKAFRKLRHPSRNKILQGEEYMK